MRVFVVVASRIESWGEENRWVAYAGVNEAKAKEVYAEIESRNDFMLSNINRPYSAEIEVWVDGVQT